MTQAQLINAIDKLMPDIVRTQQPAEVMLKFASENNLAPAQLEKLGHAFNTCKTLVGLEKSANRGDTFSLVDVPSMVADYTSYSPAKELDRQTQQVHKQVNRIIKDAYAHDGWEAVVAESGIQKAASADSIKEADSLPDIRDIVNSYYAESASKDPVVFEDVSDKSEWVELADRKLHYDIIHKSASVKTGDTYKMQKKASDELKQIAYESKCFLQEKCASLRNQFAGKGELWAEAVEDIWDTYQEKSASVLKFIEAYFNADKFLAQYPDLEKRAFVRPLVEDRHNVLDTVGEMIEVMEIHKEASSMVKEAGPFEDWFGRAALVKKLPKKYRDLVPPSVLNTFLDPSKVTLGDLVSERDRWRVKYPDHPKTKQLQKMLETMRDAYEGDNADFIPDAPHRPIDTSDYVVEMLKTMQPAAVNVGNTIKDIVGGPGDFARGFNKPLIDVDPMAVFTGVQSGLSGVSNMFKEKTDSRSKYLDESEHAVKAESTLQQILLSDPIIQEADPDKVTKLFDAIARVSPSMAEDPMLMTPALREAVQYSSLPMHLIKDYGAFEGQQVKNDKDKMETELMKYRRG